MLPTGMQYTDSPVTGPDRQLRAAVRLTDACIVLAPCGQDVHV